METGEVGLAHVCFQHYEKEKLKKKPVEYTNNSDPSPNLYNPDPSPPTQLCPEKKSDLFFVPENSAHHNRTHETKYSSISTLSFSLDETQRIS